MPWYPKKLRYHNCSSTPLNYCKTMPWYPKKLKYFNLPKSKCQCSPSAMNGMDTVFKPTQEGYPPEGASIFSSIGIMAYYFPGVSTTKPDGTDRFQSDVSRARQIWNFPIIPTRAVQLTQQQADVINLQQSDLTCSGGFLDRRARQLMASRRVTDSTRFYKDLITVWYVPFNTFERSSTVGCAWSNVGDPGSEYQHIIVTENANNSSNLSLLAHELGHIFFGTVPGQDNSDPTGPDLTTLIQNENGTTTTITPSHSLAEDNVMYPTPRNNTVVERSQRKKMASSRLVPIDILIPS